MQTKVTKETYIMLENKGESGCQLHNFSVIAMNDAGNSTASPITESIPISKATLCNNTQS